MRLFVRILILALLLCALMLLAPSGAALLMQDENDLPVLTTVLGRNITAYAAILALGAALVVPYAHIICKKRGLKPYTALDYACVALPVSLVCARLLFCLVNAELLLSESGSGALFRLWEGGFALDGAMVGCVLAALIYAKCASQSPSRVLDAFAKPLALLLAISRMAECLTGEGRGMQLEGGALCFFPLAVQNAYDEWYLSVFTLEALAALCILIALYACHKRLRADGDETLLFLMLFGASQVLLESLRSDNYLRAFTFLRVSQLGAMLFLLAALLIYTLRAQKAGQTARQTTLVWVIATACVGVCVAMEFAKDKWAFMPTGTPYIPMALSAAMLVALALRQKKVSETAENFHNIA